MKMKRKILGVAVTLAVAGLGLWSEASASANSTIFNNGKDALAGAPQGVDLTTAQNKADFKISNDINGVTGTNAAKLLGSSDGVGSPAGTGNSVVQISTASAGTNGSWGAIWSTDKTFDLTQPETGSMWIYASGENASDIGDGMAFVLQNDNRGVNAFAGTTTQGHESGNSNPVTVNVPGTGESMGVWGVDTKQTATQNLGASAIQNSWALEFDTHPNTFTPPTVGLINLWNVDDGNPASFDLGTYANQFDASGNPVPSGTVSSTDNHIASNYPAQSGTYSGKTQLGQKMEWSTSTVPIIGTVNHWLSNTGQYYYYNMQHLGYLDEGKTGSGNLSDHRWHHITVSYTPPISEGGNGSMTYTYNDKNADTGLPQTPTNSATVPIKLSAFGQNVSKVRWGFTGSTGQLTENNYVVFDQIPGRTQTAATSTMSADINSTGDYTTINSSDNKQLGGGTPVKLAYTIKRTGGQEDWEGINGTIGLPANVVRDPITNAVTSTTNLVQPTRGTITYRDSDGNVTGTRSVDVSNIVNDNQLSVPLAKDGSKNGLTLSGNETATITIDGTVKDISSTANEIPSDFVGTNASSVAKSPSFTTVKSKISMDIADDRSTLHVNYGGDTAANIIGVVVPTDNTVSPSDITVHPTLNGKALETFKQSDKSFDPGSYGSTGFQYAIPNKLLNAGSNTISFYATDTNPADGSSPVISRKIIAGTVDLGDTNEDMSFGNMTLTGSGANTTLKRDNDWGLDVIDSRAPGSGNWQLYAYADPLTTDPKLTAVATTLDGNLVYPDDANGEDKALGTSPATATPIASGTPSDDDTTKTTNIAQNWTDNSGIRLVIKGGATAGNYSGAIHWTFVNSAG